MTPHPPTAATHSPLSSSSLTQPVSSLAGSKTSPFSSSSSPPITPSLSSRDSCALGNPSRSGAPKTANAPIVGGHNERTSPTSHSHGMAIARGVAGTFSFWLQLLSFVFSNLLHKCNKTQYVHFYGHILHLDFFTST